MVLDKLVEENDSVDMEHHDILVYNILNDCYSINVRILRLLL
jgi:hypothetical protein